MKKRIVHLIATAGGTYRVEKTVNTLEPNVGAILSTNQVQELMTDTTLEVQIKDMKR